MPDEPASAPPSPDPTGIPPAPPPDAIAPPILPPLAGAADVTPPIPPVDPITLPLPGPDDTPFDLRQAMQQRMQAAEATTATPADMWQRIQPGGGAEAKPPPLETERPREEHPFVFHGQTREYFRIWIVNTLLTLLTLGVYAAWAKVRKRRYLRGSTELMGHRFDYRADPRRILVGNILVALMFLAYMVFGEVYPSIRGGALIVGVVLLPWVVVRSLAFNAHNTVYRGMRFYSRQSYGWAALTYVGQWVIIALTFGLYYPAWVRNRKRFVITSHRLGDAFFRFESKSGPFYSAYIMAALMVFAAAMAMGIYSVMLVSTNGGKVPDTVQLIPVLLVYGFAVYMSRHYVYARLFNHIWANTRLDEHQFSARLAVGGWLKLQIVNLLAIIFSCGLLHPWATIRSARYALSSLQFHPQGPIEKISRLGRSDGSAVGDTTAEFVGLDIGL